MNVQIETDFVKPMPEMDLSQKDQNSEASNEVSSYQQEDDSQS